MKGDAGADGANAVVAFPQDGPTSGAIVRTGPATFALADPGTYRLSFSVPVNEAGQLQLFLNGTALASTVAGRATRTTPIIGDALLTTTTVNSTLDVRNPSGSVNSLSISPFAGGTEPVASTLIIQRLS